MLLLWEGGRKLGHAATKKQSRGVKIKAKIGLVAQTLQNTH